MITLGIIGVVAAMTMPVLIQNARNKELEAGLKKGASTIAQALNMYEAENGEPITNDLAFHTFKPAIIKYFSVLEDCGFGYISNTTNTACIENHSDAESDKNSKIYKNFNGTDYADLALFDDGQFVLTDGSIMLLENAGAYLFISTDVNGYKKGPNRLGQDLFVFQIDDKGKLIPMGANGSAYYNKDNTYCSKTSTDKKNGAGCTYKALSDPSFWKNLP